MNRTRKFKRKKSIRGKRGQGKIRGRERGGLVIGVDEERKEKRNRKKDEEK